MPKYEHQCKEILIRSRRRNRTKFDQPRLANQMPFINISFFLFLLFVFLFSWLGMPTPTRKAFKRSLEGLDTCKSRKTARSRSETLQCLQPKRG